MTSLGEGTGRSSRESHRSYLFLSMILLVWNTLATGFYQVQIDSPLAPLPPAITSIVPVTDPLLPPPDNTVSPQRAPLSVRQKYLIGKRIDINTALKEEFNGLPGISDAMAEAIVAERERIGKFTSPRDLLQVKGIKEKRLKKILPFLK